jgi:Flp pilus assembly protein TadG
MIMKTFRQPFSRAELAHRRSGAATVELTVVLPVMLTLVLGTIEVCQRIFLRQTAILVAYEGSRLAARSTSSTQDVVSRCQQMLTQRRVVGGQVTVTPANLLEQVPGAQIQVRITIPWASNSPTRFALQDQGTVFVDAFMLRE